MESKQTFNQWVKQLSQKPIVTLKLLDVKTIDYKFSLN